MSVKLFNKEQKNRFLTEEYPNESTRLTYSSLLGAVGKFEFEKEKDVCDFSYSEAVDTMIGLKKKTFKSLDVAQTIIIKYVDWCLTEGYNRTGINSFKLLNKTDLKKYTHRIAQRYSYINRERLYDIVGQLYNYIDKAILVLLFEGVKGRSNRDHTFEELRNLKFSDLNPETNIVIVTRDNGETLSFNVDERTMDILVVASKEETYYKNNGEGTGRFAIMPLKSTNYILRTLDVESSEGEKITPSSISTRFKNFREFTGLKFLNPTLISQSGMLERCEEKEKEIGQLQSEDYRQMYRNINLDDRRWFSLKEMHEAYKKNISF